MKKFFSIRYILGRIWIAFLQGKKVKTGPFKGIILKRNINLNLFYSKLLGIYEKELHSILNDVLKKNYKQIIVVGTSDGYYFCGFLKKAKSKSIIGFETDDALRSICEETAKFNNLSKSYLLEGNCTIEKMSTVLSDSDFILMDCEGCEVELLDPEDAPQLYNCEILVECHDIFKQNITQTIMNRFRSSHSISRIEARIPKHSDIPFLPSLVSHFLRHTILGTITERPIGMHWLHLVPRKHL